MAKDYVLLKIDTERHRNGKAVADRLRGARTGGIPWMTITDASGKELTTSDGPGGNIGCPMSEAERSWFLEMLRASRQRLSEEALTEIERDLAEFAAKR